MGRDGMGWEEMGRKVMGWNGMEQAQRSRSGLRQAGRPGTKGYGSDGGGGRRPEPRGVRFGKPQHSARRFAFVVWLAEKCINRVSFILLEQFYTGFFFKKPILPSLFNLLKPQTPNQKKRTNPFILIPALRSMILARSLSCDESSSGKFQCWQLPKDLPSFGARGDKWLIR